MTTISVNFNYKAPNKRGEPNLENYTNASWTYTGPDRLWVFIDSLDGTLEPRNYLTVETDGETFNPVPTEIKVEVDPTVDPLVATLIATDFDGNAPTRSWELPDGTTHIDYAPLPPHEVYRNEGVSYDATTKTWSYVWERDLKTWDDIRVARDGLLLWSDARVREDIPDAVKSPWEEYRTALRNLPTTWSDYEPWEVKFPTVPENPNTEITPGNELPDPE
jgi:hypothetical protein